MKADAYLFEIVVDENTEEFEEFEIYEDELKEFPEEIIARAYLKDYEFIDLERICKDYKIDFDKIIGLAPEEKWLEIQTKDRKVIIPWEIVDAKYTIVKKLHTIKVRELAHAKINISHKIKQRYYFDPKEMKPLFDGNNIIEEFEKAKAEGKLCFVYVEF